MKPLICFVALKSYAVLSGDSSIKHIGGAEVQQSLLARELVRRGYSVSFVVLDHGQADGIEIDGIRLFKAYRPDAGLCGVRFFHPRLTKLWAAMARADADVYYQRGAEAETGLVARWCRWHKRGFMFAAAHDTNCVADLPLLKRRSERWMYLYGLRHADLIIAQTQQQRGLLASHFGIDSTLIRSCCEQPPAPPPDDLTDDHILWIGRLSEEKRPEWVLRLAQDLPHVAFDLVGQCNAGSTYGRELARRIESCPNVTWHGYVPHGRMADLYRRCRLLLCTSESEGFPNVFLEAWSYGRAVLSAVDPDNILTEQGLGRVGTTCETLRELIDDAFDHAGTWEQMGRRARDYVSKHHSISAAGDAMESVLHDFCIHGRSGTALRSASETPDAPGASSVRGT